MVEKVSRLDGLGIGDGTAVDHVEIAAVGGGAVQAMSEFRKNDKQDEDREERNGRAYQAAQPAIWPEKL